MRGWIIPIGGKLLSSEILERFIVQSGGANARIAIIPAASAEPDIGNYFEHIFEQHGAGQTGSIRIASRSDCEDPAGLDLLEKATGVFITGGNQLKLSALLGGTPVAKLLRIRNQQGMHVAGTSAGAAYLSEHMIAFGDEGGTPRAGMATMCAGLGLTNRVIIDQHFRQRDRLGRLLTAMSYNPFCVGVGVDEDTAAFIGPDETIDVMGTGALTVLDPASVEYSSVAETEPGDLITMVGATIHILGAGSTFNLHTRVAMPSKVAQAGTQLGAHSGNHNDAGR